jgi:hypothetical protein
MQIAETLENLRLFDFSRCARAIDEYELLPTEVDDSRREQLRELLCLSAGEFTLFEHRLYPRAFVPPTSHALAVGAVDAVRAFQSYDCSFYSPPPHPRSRPTLADVLVFAGDIVKLELALDVVAPDPPDLRAVYDEFVSIVDEMGRHYVASSVGRELWESNLVPLQSVLWKAKLACILGVADPQGDVEEFAGQMLQFVG